MTFRRQPRLGPARAPGATAFTATPPAAATTWSSNPRDHIAVFRPRCVAVPACRQPGMEWSRCRCGVVFAACHEHAPNHSIRQARAVHDTVCPSRSP